VAQEWLLLIGACFSLGMLHGVVPDEHTWPITFSYSVGAATGRGGVFAGIFFALAFTLQRAIMAQLVYFAVLPYLAFDSGLNGPIYVVVGIAMATAGYLILSSRLPHWHPLMWASRRDLSKHEKDVETKGRIPLHWCVIHGFIAGFGVDLGLFTTFVYLVAVPSMPSYLLGFLPGAAFGFGTLAVLLFIGLVFGGSLQVAKKWGAKRVETFGSLVGARSLLFGGLVFIAAGFLFYFGLNNLIPFDFGNLIVLLFMIAVIVPVMVKTWFEVKSIPP
jgi:ABC-type nickel/cobalt efflux system permease component RcnA